MRYNNSILIIISGLLLLVFSCKKDPVPVMESFELSRENLTANTDGASIAATFTYSGTINGIKACVSDNSIYTEEFDAVINGKNFTIEMAGLAPATEYQYYYSVDYGFSEPFITETKTFTTLSGLPIVHAIEVVAIDSTTFRVKSEVVSDGGQEVTERGICWNTYGDPTIDDYSLQYTDGGLGRYTIRMEDLLLGKKYYVRAYAKSTAGIGLSEEVLEFETLAPLGTPINIELSCNPEEGGTATGGGIHEVGTQCTVTASANPGYTFVNWSENSSQVSSEATYTFTVTTERNLVANFTEQAYIITAEVTPDNSGTVTGAGGYNYGEECTLTATAKPGYEFVKWTKNSTNVSTNATFTFTVNASATYVAHFQTKSYTVTVSAQPSNGGSVTGGGSYNYGQSCTVRATSAEGYSFVNWTDDDDEVSANANYTFTVTGNRTLVANFTSNAQNYTISVSANPSNGGAVMGGGTYQQGQNCTVTATANSGYTFSNWTENGNVVSTNTSYSFTVNGNRYLVASFDQNSPSWPNGVLPGVFSVSASKQVCFSQGNLQYQASTNTWRFADNQWDFVGCPEHGNVYENGIKCNNNLASPTYSGWIDLFMWGTSDYDHGAVCYRPWEKSSNSNNCYAYGNAAYNLFDMTGKADWGYNAIMNGGDQENYGWRTLKNEEWVYLIQTRQTTSGLRYAMAYLEDVPGIVLLPDDWNMSTFSFNDANIPWAQYDSNIIDLIQWGGLEQSGAVFLPASGSMGYNSVNNHGFGVYWSSSQSDDESSYDFIYTSGIGTAIQTLYRAFSCAVRLVKE